MSIRKSVAILAITAICSGISQHRVSAQFFRPTTRSGRFIEAPRAVLQQLREAERSLEQGEESDAVVRLGDLLQRDPGAFDDSDLAGQDFFLDIDAAERQGRLVSDSLLRRARQMIGGLSTSALETYELRYGPLARRMLAEAAASRDWEAVRTVRRRYFHTLAGYESSWLLAQQELLGGHPLGASLLLDEVVAMNRAVSHLGPAVVRMHAAAKQAAGRSPSDKDQDNPAVRAYQSGPSLVTKQTAEYPLWGASPSRNGNSAGQMPLANERWKLPTTASPTQQRDVEGIAEDLATAGKLPPPSWTPLQVGDQLLMRTTERLVGVDFKTGKRVWTWPWFQPGFDERQLPDDSIAGEEDAVDLLSQRVWNDLPYGQMTSDGQRVYLIDNLGEVEIATFSAIGFGGTRPSDTRTNTLVALELATEGKLRWRLGAESTSASDLSNAFFLGPPLPVDGRLYVLAEIAGDINLVCLEPETGEELWRQQLVAVESGSVDMDPIRRVAGAMPSYHEGLLICNTGAGAIVAIDLSDRVLRWGMTFDRNIEMLRSLTGRGGLEPTLLMQRWYSGAAIATDDTLLVTPIESDRLFGLELLTGKQKFAPKNRVHMRYLAGARDGLFFVVGANQMRAFDIQTGASRWTTPPDLLAAGEQIVGTGVFGVGDYLLPTTSNQLIRVSLESGIPIERRTTRYDLGNLIAVDGNVIVQGASAISVAYGESSLEPVVTRMLEENPNDFIALVRKSELLIQAGQRREALELLARARELDPGNDEVHLLSVAAMLGELRENLDVDGELVETLEQLIDRPAQRAELLSLRIRSHLSRSEYFDAAWHLIALSSLISERPRLNAAADQVVGDTSRHCSIDSWVAARVSEVARGADSKQLQSINELVAGAMMPQLPGADSLLKRMVRHFGSLAGVDAARAELADRFAKAGDAFELERLSLGLQVPDAAGFAQLSNERLLMLARVYASNRLSDDARTVIKILRARDDPALTPELDQLSEAAERASSQVNWTPNVSLTWEGPKSVRPRAFAISGQRVARNRMMAGESFRNWSLVSDGASPLALRDGTGQLRPIALDGFDRRNENDKEAIICGSVMVILMPTELIAVDLYHVLTGDGELVLWRRGLSGDGSPIATGRMQTNPFEDQVVRYNLRTSSPSRVLPEFRFGPIIGDRLLVLQGGDLMALDLLTSETLWRNSSAPQRGAVACDGQRVAVVSSEDNTVEYFDVLDGRKLESMDWNLGEVWVPADKYVLCYEDKTRSGEEHEVRLINPFTREVILRHDALHSNRTAENSPCSYGRVVSGRYLVMLSSDGQAVIWDLAEAREIAKPQLPAYADLQGLHAVVLDGQIVLLPKRRVERVRLPEATTLQTAEGRNHATVHGAFAFSLDDGSSRWQQEFEKPWGCTVHQPAETPALFFTRSKAVFNSPTTGRRKEMDALAIDVRTGQELNRTTGKSVISSSNALETRLTIQSGLSRVIVQVGNEILTYKFGSQPPQ